MENATQTQGDHVNSVSTTLTRINLYSHGDDSSTAVRKCFHMFKCSHLCEKFLRGMAVQRL